MVRITLSIRASTGWASALWSFLDRANHDDPVATSPIIRQIGVPPTLDSEQTYTFMASTRGDGVCPH